MTGAFDDSKINVLSVSLIRHKKLKYNCIRYKSADTALTSSLVSLVLTEAFNNRHCPELSVRNSTKLLYMFSLVIKPTKVYTKFAVIGNNLASVWICTNHPKHLDYKLSIPDAGMYFIQFRNFQLSIG